MNKSKGNQITWKIREAKTYLEEPEAPVQGEKTAAQPAASDQWEEGKWSTTDNGSLTTVM